jgi:hypothetical protein
VRPECESSRAGIACGQLRAVSTAERRGWYWPTNKDARRWPVCWLPRWPKAYLYALSGRPWPRVWPGDGDLNGDRIGKGSTCASTRLRVLLRTAVPVWRVGRALRGGRAWNSTTTCSGILACQWVGSWMYHGCAEKHFINMHRATVLVTVYSCVTMLVCVELQSTKSTPHNSAVKTPTRYYM